MVHLFFYPVAAHWNTTPPVCNVTEMTTCELLVQCTYMLGEQGTGERVPISTMLAFCDMKTFI